MFTLSDLSGWRVIKAIAEVRPNNMDALLFAILGGTVPWLGFGYGVAILVAHGGPKKRSSVTHRFPMNFATYLQIYLHNVRIM
jgi:hypothetical protein